MEIIIYATSCEIGFFFALVVRKTAPIRKILKTFFLLQFSHKTSLLQNMQFFILTINFQTEIGLNHQVVKSVGKCMLLMLGDPIPLGACCSLCEYNGNKSFTFPHRIMKIN